jgi:hypothetical protein
VPRYVALSLIVTSLLLPRAASQIGTFVAPTGRSAQSPDPGGPAAHLHDRKEEGRDSGGSHPEHSENVTSAQRQAWYGEYQLSWGHINEARDRCNAALNADPANQTAIRCLNEAATMAVDDQLNQADKLLLQNKPADATVLAASVAHSQVSLAQTIRANDILRNALPSKAWMALPDWLRAIVDSLLFVLVVTLIVRLFRWLGVKARTRKFLRRKTVWALLPLRDLPGSSDAERATDALLDSMARLGEELKRQPWKPGLLLLRPTPPADYEPAVISDFLSTDPRTPIVLAPDIPSLQTEWSFHEVRLDDAIQNLQLKAAAGVDLGAFLRFLMALGKWISADKPTISGTVEIGSGTVDTLPATGSHSASESGPTTATRSVAIHLAARGIQVPTISITTSSDFQPGIDCVQLAAERAAFKFLIRMQFPQMTNDEVSGHAALRQGASLFTEFACTVPDGGPAAATRTSSLRSAARNFAFFRSSIPRFAPSGLPEPFSASAIPISDEIRQGVLLAEGVALALIDDPSARNAAISSFRQCREWPGSAETQPLRQQAAYNEALVRRSLGFYGQCVLMLTELLGDDIPGADGKKPAAAQADVLREQSKQLPHPNPNRLPPALLYAARLARDSPNAKDNFEFERRLPFRRKSGTD